VGDHTVADSAIYVPRLWETGAVLAWGTTDGKQTIGRRAPGLGHVSVWLNGQKATSSDVSFASLEGLAPDTEYHYVACLGNRVVGQAGSFRTFPAAPSELRFLVIGDYGDGSKAQHALGKTMAIHVAALLTSTAPVRFIVTTGDNIYRKKFPCFPVFWKGCDTGDSDRHWKKKYFSPYRQLLSALPVFPTPGNHDRGETERESDVLAFLDNFFYKGSELFYSVRFGGLLKLFSLNTSVARADTEAKARELGRDSEQVKWLTSSPRSEPAPRWAIAAFHHPRFTAGSRHHDSESRERSEALLDALGGSVQIVFSGHEHNFQVSRPVNGVRYFVTGAAGRLDRGEALPTQADLDSAGIQTFVERRHFLDVLVTWAKITVRALGDDGTELARVDVPHR